MGYLIELMANRIKKKLFLCDSITNATELSKHIKRSYNINVFGTCFLME